MPRRIFCPLHGNIELSDLTCSILDTPEMQRLRDIKQLGSLGTSSSHQPLRTASSRSMAGLRPRALRSSRSRASPQASTRLPSASRDTRQSRV